MKKLLNSFVAVLTVFIALFALSCCEKTKTYVLKENDNFIVISASNEQLEITETTTLLDYMNSLKGKELEFEIKNGMVTSVNGIENAADFSSCWMLYTSDKDNSNTAWGEVEFKGEKYGSATFGAESLIIKDGETYIWVYTTF